MIHACHNKRGHKSHHNVGTCLRHVSTQAPMYQRIENKPKEPSLWYAKRNTNIEKLQSQVQQMQKQHDTQIHNLREMHRQELDMKEKELSRLARIIDKAFRWFPMFREMLRMEKFCAMLGFSKEMTESLIVKKEALKCSGKIYSEQHRRNFDIKDDILRVENDPDDESRLNLTINRKPIADWFMEQWHRLRYGTRLPQQEERKSRGFKL